MKKTLMMSLLGMMVCGQSFADNSIHTGKGTFYGYGGGGNCSFPMPADDIYTAAMNAKDYHNAAACGAYVQVTNTDTDQTITVRIDDKCPECAEGSIDLDQAAFAKIADLETGIIPIRWTYVASEQEQNMKLNFKEGSSQWWTGIQVRDHKYPIAKLEYRNTGSGERYTSVKRQPYNYFVKADGFGIGPYDFRITDVWGQSVEVKAVSLTLDSEIDTATQFPAYKGDRKTSPGSVSSKNSVSPHHSASSDVHQGHVSTPTGHQGDITISEHVDSSWDGGLCETVTVTNHGSSDVDWHVTLNTSGNVYTLWNGDWSQSGSKVSVSGVAWNHSLSAGDRTTFGFCENR